MDELKEQLSPQQISERAELEKAFREVFALAAGKRVLFWMLEQCAIYHNPHMDEATHVTSHKLGEQNVGRKLIAMLDEVDPRFYPTLLLAVAGMKAMEQAAAAAKQEIEDEE